MEQFRVDRPIVSLSTDRKKKDYASSSNFIGTDRRRLPLMAGESVYSHGRKYQINSQRSCGDRRRVVAPKRIWSLTFAVANSCGVTSRLVEFTYDILKEVQAQQWKRFK